MKIFNAKNILFVILLINISLINSQAQSEFEIPFSYSPDKGLPEIDILLGEDVTPNPLILDIGQEKSWIYKSNETPIEKKDLTELKFEAFSVYGQNKKNHCYLSKDKILKIDNFEYLEVPKVKGDELFLNSIALNNVILNTEVFKNDIKEQNYGFNIDFPSQKLHIGKLQKENLKRLELKDDKWKLSLDAIIFDDFNLNDKMGDVYKITNKTKGLVVNRDIVIETVYSPFYVPKDFFDFLEDNNYFYNGKEKLCDRKILNGNIVYICDKSQLSKIKNLNLVLNKKFVLTLTKDNLVKCSDNSNTCDFNIKYNPKFNNFVLGVDVLKKFNIYFMKNENNVYFKGVEILECDLTNAQLSILGKKDKMKALFQLVQTFTVIVVIFIFLFIFFYLHSKFRGHHYTDKKEDKNDGEELVDVEDKEKN